jgi:hypothetical protein
VKRDCKIVRPSPDGKRAIYVDTLNKNEIKGYLFSDDRHKKKFQFICDIIFGGHRNTELYDKEDINERCSDVTAMKFFKRQENDRIYCKELKSKSGISIVVMSILHPRKKSDGNSNKEITLIETVASYEYEI